MNKEYNVCVSEDNFINSFLDSYYDENMFKSDGTLNKNHNSFKKTGLISKIFEDHWYTLPIETKNTIKEYRPNADKEIKKIIDCYNKDLGCTVYQCPECNDFVFVGNTCKSRFCSSCGYKYKLERVDNILNTAYKCNHRQIVFTIPKEFRKYFFDFSLMHILFEAVNLTINSIINEEKFNKPKKNKKRKKKYKSRVKWTPGFFAFLHTFGRDLKWNPHIHVLIAEIKLGNNNSYKDVKYFDFDALSKRFQLNLLNLMSKHIGPSFDNIKRQSFIRHSKGFYVYAESKKFNSLKEGIEYVARYSGRCAISENRIVDYDGESVTFCYNAHEDDSYHEVTVTAQDFILLLLRHLVPSQFKIIRYYGFYRKKHSFHDKMVLLVAREKIPFKKQLLKHFMSILNAFNRLALNCPHCDIKMKYVATIT